MNILNLEETIGKHLPPRAVSIASHTGVGLWWWNPANGDFAGDDQLNKVLGVERNYPASQLIDVVVENDRPLVAETTTRAVSEMGSYDILFRITRPCDGEERIIHSHGRMVSQDLMHGFSIDVTDAMNGWMTG